MRSLFAKILIWFILTTVLTGAAFFVTNAFLVSQPRHRQFPMGQLLRVQAREARHAWETGGREALAATLMRFSEGGPLRCFLTDAAGQDLVTGQDLSALVRDLAPDGGRPLMRGGSMILGRRSDDGRYWFFIEVPRRRFFGWFLHPAHLWILSVGVLLCYLLARYLTAPLRQLQKAVEAFGQGDLSVRVRSKRRDELGELARNFDRMADRIQNLIAAEKQLLADISHELRSPLARLGLAAELARTGDDRAAAIDRIQREADRLNELVGELLQVSRVEVDPEARRAEPVRVDELLAQSVEDAAMEADVRRVRIRLSAPEPATLIGDRELLRRAVENVLRNAIRHSPEETEVLIELSVNPARVLIAVQDCGPGVPEELLHRIFDPFYRVEADRGRTSGGAGLGLAIARRAVELHQGMIRARNTHPGLRVEMEFLL